MHNLNLKLIVMRLRVNEAIAKAQTKGKKVYKKDIAEKIWSESSQQAQQVNMTSLCNGRTKYFKPEWVEIICEMCEVSPNYLFGYED